MSSSSGQRTKTRPAESIDLASMDVHFESTRSRLGPIGAALRLPLASYYLVMMSCLLLLAVGLLMVLSASSVLSSVKEGNSYYYMIKQCLFLAAGLPMAFALSRCNERILRFLAWPAIILAGILLILVFTPMGVASYGNRAWLDLGPIRLQPSELAKAALVLWSATVLSNRRRTLDQPKRLLFPYLVVAALMLGLVLAERDLGTALVLGGIMVMMLWFVGAPASVLAGITSVAGLGGALLVVTNEERMRRIFGFLGAAGGSTSDQPLNAIYALASGGWFGVGLGGSRQKWGGLKNGAQTDYIFAVLGEELGLLGTLTVICLFVVLGYAGFRIALRSTSSFWRLTAAGMTGWLMVQGLINICVAMKMLPVIGLPLPFISYGGSALLANLIAAGILLAAARHEPEAIAVLAERSKRKPRVTGVVAPMR